jgi:hypothetical protein
MIKEEIKKEIENYKTLKWYETSRGKSVIILGVIFLITFWFRSFLAILILPIIYLVKKGSKTGIILAGLYSGFLTIVNIAVYIENNRNEQGDFYSSMTPVYIFIGILIFTIILLKNAYIVEKNKSKLSADEVAK